MQKECEVAIIGAGVGGLTLALCLHQAGISCRVYEAAEQIRPLGVGINVLPHAVRELERLGLLDKLAAVAVTTKESAFFNSHGQFVYSEPAGRLAGYHWPQFSIHRGDLQMVLLEAVRERMGHDAVLEGHRCLRYEQDAEGVTAYFDDGKGGPRAEVRSTVLIACDGIHSVVRKSLYPEEGAPRYSGVNMWRGSVAWKPFLSGASMVRAGWLTTGKMVIYPIRDAIDADGNQLVNWVAEIEAPQPARRDWNNKGRLEDFFPAFADWSFDWLDVAAMIKATDLILEYPMVDQDPLPRWSFDRVSLLGDAAHPMVPRGSNGAGQAILDGPCLVEQFKLHGINPQALSAYDEIRRTATAEVVLMNRKAPPDAILQEVHERTGGKAFGSIDDVISQQALSDISNRYKNVAGLNLDILNQRGTVAP
ncbi:flavin-dependent oxidoreductase [Undibacterium sp. TJN25]|uniref:flavin-dependent oxidoreductase n=1 Tax=Undibacterium sp. TJN25 TaxID=3413056 RepID=UPI003BEFE735